MQNNKLEKEDAILIGDALEKDFFFFLSSIGIFFRAQALWNLFVTAQHPKLFTRTGQWRTEKI